MADPIDIQVRDRVSANIAAKFREIGTEARTAHTSVELLKQELGQFRAVGEIQRAARQTGILSTEIRKATSSMDRLAASNTNNTQALVRNTTASNNLTAAYDRTAATSNRLRQSTNNLSAGFRRMFGLLATYVGGRALIQFADQATTLRDQLSFVVDETATVEGSFNDLADIARATGLRFQDVGQQFTANARIMSELGQTTQEQIQFQEGFSGAIATSGLRGEQANVVLNALTRSMARGTLRGEEFNTVMERGQDVIRLISDEMGVTTGELRALAQAGEITSDRLINAFTGPIDEINERVSNMSWSIAGAFNAVSTELVRYISQVNQGTDASRIIANVILTLADNLNIVVPLIAAFAGAWALVQIAGVVQGIYGMIAALAALAPVLAAHPLLLLAGLVTASALAVAHLTGNLDGMVEALQKGIQDITGFEQANERASQSVEEVGRTANNNLSNLVNFGGDGAAAVDTVTGANDNLGSSMLASNDNTEQLRASIAELGNGSEDIEKAGSSVSELEGETVGATEQMDRLRDAALGAAEAVRSLNRAQSRAENSTPANGNGSGSNNGSSESDTPGFNTGGSFMVAGRTGVDKNMVQFRASRGERVDVLTPAQQRAQERAMQGGARVNNNNVNFTVVTPNPDQFRRSRSQIARDIGNILNAG